MYLFFIVIVAAFGFCVWGFIVSLKAHRKTKKLQASADYNFKTQNGNYSFIYTIKGFNEGGKKKIRILIQPVLGFSDLKTNKTNTVLTWALKATNNRTGFVHNLGQGNFANGGLNVTLTCEFNAPTVDANGVVDLNFTVDTTWNLGGYVVEESLNFDYNK